MRDHTQMHGSLGNAASHTDTIVCRKCGQRGAIIWDDVVSVDGPRKELVLITDEFYERLSKNVPFPIELVCNACGAVQSPPEVQP